MHKLVENIIVFSLFIASSTYCADYTDLFWPSVVDNDPIFSIGDDLFPPEVFNCLALVAGDKDVGSDLADQILHSADVTSLAKSKKNFKRRHRQKTEKKVASVESEAHPQLSQKQIEELLCTWNKKHWNDIGKLQRAARNLGVEVAALCSALMWFKDHRNSSNETLDAATINQYRDRQIKKNTFHRNAQILSRKGLSGKTFVQKAAELGVFPLQLEMYRKHLLHGPKLFVDSFTLDANVIRAFVSHNVNS